VPFSMVAYFCIHICSSRSDVPFYTVAITLATLTVNNMYE
jgi:hypothetical protein